MNNKNNFALDMNGLGDGLDFIQKELSAYIDRQSELFKAMMLAEEFIIKLIDSNGQGSSVETSNSNIEKNNKTYSIELHRRFKTADISIMAKGAPMDFGGVDITQDFDMSGMSDEVETGIRNILLRSYKSRVSYSYKENTHKAKIKVGNVDTLLIGLSIVMLILGILLGFLLRVLSQNLSPSFMMPVEYVFKPLTLLFIKSMNLCIMPVIFLRITSAVIHTGGFLHPGRAGGKILVSYSLTSIMAVIIGFGAFEIVNPGTYGLLRSFIDLGSSTDVSISSISLREIFLSIVPMDIVTPFSEGQSLQVIFMAIVCGIALLLVGSTNPFMLQLVEGLNEMMEKTIYILSQFVPIAVLCSSVTITSSIGISAILGIFSMVATLMLALFLLCIAYCLLLLIFGRLNPVLLLRKFAPNIKRLIGLTASDERIMQIMRFTKSDLGLSRKLTSFAVPLGSTLNLDGQSIYLAVVAPFIAKICGVDLYGGALLYLTIAILLLSVGAPNSFGSGLVCMTAIMSQCNIPLIGLAAVVMVDFLFAMVLTITNSFGDIVAITVVARSEKMIDLDKYNSN